MIKVRTTRKGRGEMRYIVHDQEADVYVALDQPYTTPNWTRTGAPLDFASLEEARSYCVAQGLNIGSVQIQGTIDSGYSRYHAVEFHPVEVL